LLSYGLALVLTLALEIPAYALLLRYALGVSLRSGAAAGGRANLVSHPLAFLVVMPLLAPQLGFWPALAVVEAAVWGLEAAILRAWLKREGEVLLLAALAANALSLIIGLSLL
jgi:hypothetical protein